MHMKDDHMRNAQLKPGYNVQIGVDSEYIVAADIFQDRNDVWTLVPFLETMSEKVGFRYPSVTADSGYESEEGYTYLREQKQKPYIKPQTYEKWKKRSFKQDISKRENMGYDETRFARQEGLERIILETSADEILIALREAQIIIDQIDAKNKQNEELNTIFNIINEGLIMFDPAGNITLMNQLASSLFNEEKFLTSSDNSMTFPWVEQVITSMKKDEAMLNVLQEYKNTKYISSIYPVRYGEKISGAVMKLQRIQDIQGIEQSIRNQLFKHGLIASHTFADIIGNSAILKKSIMMARRYSGVDSTVLITGESGTGKELFAQSIHNCSLRINGPFVAVNCAAIPPTLLESELFGYKEGAFTGARKSGKTGLFELAHNGTIFLDEIGEIDMSIQARLLRVLEEKRIMRLGDDKIIPVNVRIIAATNKNLHEMVKNGQFREDFFYRLNVLAIELPPLRKRKEDLELLIHHFLKKECTKLKRPPIHIKPEGMKILINYDWPGNIRELANIIERLVVISLKKDVDAKIVREAMGIALSNQAAPQPRSHSFTDSKEKLLEHEEQSIIKKVLEDCGGNKSEAASRLGISRPTLYQKLKKHNINI
jgi:transcriptional regulator with PAS, ATPase and Fis domain